MRYWQRLSFTLLAYAGTGTILAVLALCAPPVWAAECDNVTVNAAVPAEFIRSYQPSLHSPARLAIDAQDNVYILDSLNRRVVVRSPAGRVIFTMTDLDYPVSIAVDTAGRIYIGEGKLRRVDIYSATGQHVAVLGSGNGEFVLPTFLKVHEDTTGTHIYVVDSGADLVKRYDGASGLLEFSFGGSGAAEGQLRLPSGITILGDELIIVDRGNARLQAFDHTGAFVRVIAPPPDDCGFFCLFGGPTTGRPHDTGIAAGPGSTLYLAEGSKGRLLVLGANGTGLGTVGDFGVTPGKLRVPTDMVIDSCGRLFVTSVVNARVEMFGLPGHQDPERFAPGRLTVGNQPLNPLTDVQLVAHLELPGYRPTDVTGILANGFAAPVSVTVGDSDRNNVRDLQLVFGDDLVSSLLGASSATVTVTGSVGSLEFEESVAVTIAGADRDSDGDGVADGIDACPGTPAEDTVGLDGCGLTQRCPCAGPVAGIPWTNHGEYVNCVEGVSREFVDSGVTTPRERGQIIRRAARSACGRPNTSSLQSDSRAGWLATGGVSDALRLARASGGAP